MHVTSGSGASPAPLPDTRYGPPSNEIPVALPWTTLLARSADIAVALLGARVWTTGLELDVAVRRRTPPPHHEARRALDLLGGGPEPGGALRDYLLLGVGYADGRTATNLAGRPWDAPPERVTLVANGGGGGGLVYDQTYWLTPLPATGPITLVCAWPGQGVPESRVVLDGDLLAGARARVEVLWDPVAEPEFEPEPEIEPDDGGLPEWFTAAVRRDRQA